MTLESMILEDKYVALKPMQTSHIQGLLLSTSLKMKLWVQPAT